eukprot:TRINITY_DN17360_c1_g1_i1.p1 TRINITY_DN17360_c1_g1~~TRINITY_DN17360_c1_g1_i1.p1  ORF type:complete len:175 (+),score=34.59 TRINITY_DN17360_c1_g1_i1:81-605(+)
MRFLPEVLVQLQRIVVAMASLMNLVSGKTEFAELQKLVLGSKSDTLEARTNQVALAEAVKAGVGDLPEEIEVETSWGEILEPSPPPCTARQFEDHEIFFIDNLLSPEECTRLVQEAEQRGFGATSYRKSYRGNLRLITVDKSLTEAMWSRLRPLVPPRVELRGETWEVCGLTST